MSLHDITTSLQTERLLNRLHHSTKVFKRCIEIFSLDQAKELVSEKIVAMTALVAKEQAKVASMQVNWQINKNAMLS